MIAYAQHRPQGISYKSQKGRMLKGSSGRGKGKQQTPRPAPPRPVPDAGCCCTVRLTIYLSLPCSCPCCLAPCPPYSCPSADPLARRPRPRQTHHPAPHPEDYKQDAAASPKMYRYLVSSSYVSLNKKKYKKCQRGGGQGGIFTTHTYHDLIFRLLARPICTLTPSRAFSFPTRHTAVQQYDTLFRPGGISSKEKHRRDYIPGKDVLCMYDMVG